jgi:hypothetical protein
LTNYMLMQMVKGKATMIAREVGEGVPFVEEGKERGEENVEIRKQSAKKEEAGDL